MGLLGFKDKLNDKKGAMKELMKSISDIASAIMQRVHPAKELQVAEVLSPFYDEIQLEAKSVFMPDVMIEGRLSCQEDLIVGGQFKGSITAAKNSVVIGPNGRVHADIKASRVLIEGTIIGNIVGEKKVVMTSTAVVTGNIQAAMVYLKNGARFKGVIEIDPEKAESVESLTEIENQSETDRLALELS